jgi:hypothetical protein
MGRRTALLAGLVALLLLTLGGSFSFSGSQGPVTGGSATASSFRDSTAEGELWYTDPGEVMLSGPEEATEFTGEGELSTNTLFTTGPYKIDFRGFLWNGSEHGEGVIDEASITGAIPTSLPGCTATATMNTEGGAEWDVTLAPEQAIEISGITFVQHFAEGCNKYGLPPTYSVAGALTGTYNDETGCIEYISAGDLHIEGPSISLAQSGEICIHEPEEGKFTINP